MNSSSRRTAAAMIVHLAFGVAVSSAASATYITLADPTAVCLDGSRYGFAFCPSSQSNASWEINIQGGGWCYNEVDCLQRAGTALGSNATWPAEAAKYYCDPATNPTNTANMFYGDGASFTGYREEAWPVPGTSSSLWFRGIRNLDATLDRLLSMGMDQASKIVLSGGSAGGLSTFLHLDHVAARMAVQAPAARVVGMPICGFFLDHGNDGFAPANVTYTLQMQYVYNMQNSTGSLSPTCQQSLAPDSWKCIMAPHAAPFIQTSWFALQSRFDHWQLAEELFMPCIQAQPYAPPYKPSSCTGVEDAAIQQYGFDFMDQFAPLMTPDSKNGAFVDACIIHGSTNSSIDGLNNYAAFDAWYAGNSQQWWIMKCGNGPNATSAGPCDPSPICAPFP